MTDNSWQDEELWIVTANTPEDTSQDGMKAVRCTNPYDSPKDQDREKEIKDSRIKAGTLAVQMSQFVGVVNSLFSHVQKQVQPQSELTLDEITLTVEITGEGEIKLLGTGVKAAGKGAIELKFKRSSPENQQ